MHLRLSKYFGLLFASLLSVNSAFGLVSINSSASIGYLRDIEQNAHVPLFYNLSYSGLYRGEIESEVNLILNNDLMESRWYVIPSQATVSIPLGSGYSLIRRSRVVLGRQLFAEGFDLWILDGANTPFYWSESGGIVFYGGNTHQLDLLDSSASPVVGTTLFQKILGAQVRLGPSWQSENLAQMKINGALLVPFSEWPLSPLILLKAETDQDKKNLTQSLTEISFSPADMFGLSLSYTKRAPTNTFKEKNVFLFRIFSKTAVEISQVAMTLQIHKSLELGGTFRKMDYSPQTVSEQAYQEEVVFHWIPRPNLNLSPYFHHFNGWGGSLWDSGIETKFGRTIQFQTALASAYYEKINKIKGWAYSLRAGANLNLASRFTTMIWAELERNPLFEYDGRVFGNVTYYY